MPAGRERGWGEGDRARFMVPTRPTFCTVPFREPERRPQSSRTVPTSIALLLVIGLGAGCIPNQTPADLTIINGPEPESLDPVVFTGQADGRIVSALFEGLTRYHPQTARPEPGLAERWTISEDGRTYTFHLRENAAWSTGEPITAHDVVYSWRRLLDPMTAADYVGLLFYIRGAEDYATGKAKDPKSVGIRAIDDHTLRVELRGPTPFFLDLCAYPTTAVVPRGVIEAHGNDWLKVRPLPCSGAYELVSWRLNEKVRVRANPHYWDTANTRSKIIDLIPCTVPGTALNLYQSGIADIIWDKELVPSELLDVLRTRDDFHTYSYLGTYFFRFNVTRPPFDDPRVRKALALAIDRRRIVEKITKAGELPVSHYVPPGVAGYTSPEGLGYDPALGRELLAEAGFPDGRGFPRFEYMFNNVKSHEKIAIELQEMWRRELGIHTELRQLEWKVYLNAQSDLEYDLSRSSWIGDYNDPNTFLDLFMTNNGNNRTGWKNARYDELIHAANSTTDPERRAEFFRQAETILIREEIPIVPLFIYVGLEYFDPRKIEGVHPNLLAEHPLRAIRKVTFGGDESVSTSRW